MLDTLSDYSKRLDSTAGNAKRTEWKATALLSVLQAYSKSIGLD